jgi:hypothetical protein
VSKDGNFSYESFDEVQDDILELQREQTRLDARVGNVNPRFIEEKLGGLDSQAREIQNQTEALRNARFWLLFSSVLQWVCMIALAVWVAKK